MLATSKPGYLRVLCENTWKHAGGSALTLVVGLGAAWIAWEIQPIVTGAPWWRPLLQPSLVFFLSVVASFGLSGYRVWCDDRREQERLAGRITELELEAQKLAVKSIDPDQLRVNELFERPCQGLGFEISLAEFLLQCEIALENGVAVPALISAPRPTSPPAHELQRQPRVLAVFKRSIEWLVREGILKSDMSHAVQFVRFTPDGKHIARLVRARTTNRLGL